MAPEPPEYPQCPPSRGSLGLPPRERPAHGGPEVGVLFLQPFHPLYLIRPLKLWLRPLGEVEEELRVPPPRLVGLAALPQLLERVLPDRLQHPVAHLVAPRVRLGHHDERLLHQPPEESKDLIRTRLSGRTNRLRRLQGEAPGEHTKPAEQDLLLF